MQAIKEQNVTLSSCTLERLNAPGIREIKQVELWKNWSQFAPYPHKEVICPKPQQDVTDRKKREKSAKQKAATKKRKAEAK